MSALFNDVVNWTVIGVYYLKKLSNGLITEVYYLTTLSNGLITGV